MKYTKENCIGMMIVSYGSTYKILKIEETAAYLEDMENPSRGPFRAGLNIKDILRNMNNGNYHVIVPETYQIY